MQKKSQLFLNKISKKLYNNYFVRAENYWNSALNTELPWQRLWLHTYTSYVTGKHQDVFFKILHNCLPTGAQLQKGRKRARDLHSIKCPHCKVLETTTHIFAECRHAKKVWQHYQQIYEKLLPSTRFDPTHSFLTHDLAQLTDLNLKKLLLTLSHLIVIELWHARCAHKFENTPRSLKRSVTSINTQLRHILKTWYTHHLKNNSLRDFERKFTIQHQFCVIRRNRLYFTLPPFTG